MTTHLLRIGDIIRTPRCKAIVFGISIQGDGRLLARCAECRPGGGYFNVTKRGTVPVVTHDLEVAAMAWDLYAAQDEAALRRARTPHVRAIYEQLIARSRRNANRIRLLVERAA